MRAVQRVTITAAAALLALGCGGRFLRDEDASAGAGRASVAAEGGAPSAGGAGNIPPSAAGAPSGGAPTACQSVNNVPSGVPTSTTAQNVSGKYRLVTCGQATPCTQPGNPVTTRMLDDTIELSVSQNPDDLSHGTVTLNGTGELLLDGRAFDAKFTRRSFTAELNGPINAVCSEEYDLRFSYDFDGYGPRTFNLDFERSPTCSGNNGSEYCQGNVHSTFGSAALKLE